MQRYIWNIWTRASRGSKLAKFVLRLIEVLMGAYLPPSAQFGNQPCFPHGIHGVFISSGTRVGRNSVIFQGVTIGSNTLIDSATIGSPTIGDNCYIGAGAKVIGGITIGNNVRVGANAVVFKNVPDNATVVGFQRVIQTAENDNRYFAKRWGKWHYFANGAFHEASSVEAERLSNPSATDR